MSKDFKYNASAIVPTKPTEVHCTGDIHCFTNEEVCECGKKHNSFPQPKETWQEEFDEEFPSPDGRDFIGMERISSLKSFISTQKELSFEEGVKSEKERIKKWAEENHLETEIWIAEDEDYMMAKIIYLTDLLNQ